MQSKLQLNDLHVELIQEIFLFVISHPQNDLTPRSPSILALPAPYTSNYRSPASPFAISHVCKYWRNIALRFPNLWTHLCVLSPKTSKVVQFVKEWINRAGYLPLYLSFHETTGASLSATKLIIHLFLDNVHRCIHFEMGVQTDLLKLIDSKKLHLQIPCRLEYLSIRTHDPLQRFKTITLLNYFLTSPGLQSVVLSCPVNLRNLPDIAKRWVNLRELSLLMPLSFDQISFALSLCENLDRLVINRPPMRYLAAQEGIILPRLTKLSATLGPRDSLSCFIVPSLTECEVVTVGGLCWNTIGCLFEKSAARPKVLRFLKSRLPEDVHVSKAEERMLLHILRNPFLQDLRNLEVEQYVGLDTLNFLQLPRSHDENPHNGQISQSEGYLCNLEKCSLVLLPTTRILDVWHALDTLCGSRLGADRNKVRNEYLQFSEDTLQLSLSITQPIRHI